MGKKIFTLAELATYTNAQLIGNPAHTISGIADLDSASMEDASFLANPNYEKAMKASNAGVVFIAPDTKLIEGRNFLITQTPSKDFQKLLEAFIEEEENQTSGFEGIHPSAVIHPSAKIGIDVTIGPHAVIDKNVIISHNTIVSAGCYIGSGSSIGHHCLIYPNVTIRECCSIGNNVIIQPGAVIGSCGFGYLTDEQGHHTKLNQIGTVIIEDDVEIGANTTIDRSRFKSTEIRQGSKIDNLVQIAHGVIIGKHNIIVSQTGIAGSSETGNYVVIAAQAGVAGHLFITHKTMIAAKAGVSKSITTSGNYRGIPAVPIAEFNRNSVYLRNIEKYIDRIKALEEQLMQLQISDKNHGFQQEK